MPPSRADTGLSDPKTVIDGVIDALSLRHFIGSMLYNTNAYVGVMSNDVARIRGRASPRSCTTAYRILDPREEQCDRLLPMMGSALSDHS